jgi:hypothetical protein
MRNDSNDISSPIALYRAASAALKLTDDGITDIMMMGCDESVRYMHVRMSVEYAPDHNPRANRTHMTAAQLVAIVKVRLMHVGIAARGFVATTEETFTDDAGGNTYTTVLTFNVAPYTV